MPPRTFRAVLFDLDGTLLDTLPDLSEAANRMLQDLHLPMLPQDVVRAQVGRGVANLVRRCLTQARPERAPSDQESLAALAVFRRHYAAVNGLATRAYPGVTDTLTALAQAGLKLACVTNKSAEFTDPLLHKTGLAPYFDQVISGDTLPHKKPHPMPLLEACQAFNAPPQTVLMVGDSMNDIAAARAAGCPVVAVPYGYNEGEPLDASLCDALLECLPDVLDHVGVPRAHVSL